VQKIADYLTEIVRSEIEPLITGLGLKLVEVKVSKSRGATKIQIVIYQPERGVSLKDCENVSRHLYPQLELISELGDFTLEVSSPGLGRELHDQREFVIFKGQLLKVLLEGESEWVCGRIEEVQAENLFLKTRGEMISLPLRKIKRAKLANIEGEE